MIMRAVWPIFLDPWLTKKERMDANFFGEYEFVDRKKNASILVVIVAGYKEFLWSKVFRRFALYTPKEFDVCVVCPGKDSAELRRLCEENQWSFLRTQENLLALAQNLAIRLHSEAKDIFKFDEDIFISDGYYSHLLQLSERIGREKMYEAGFIAPMVNVNGYSYKIFLNRLGQMENWLEKFDVAPSSCTKTPAWQNPHAAEFLWKLSHPFDELARRFLGESQEYSVCPHRFSIGAILFKRDIWENICGFTVGEEGKLGAEETDLCCACMTISHVIIVSHNVLAGHFGFEFQTPHMRELLQKSPEFFPE